MIDNSEAVERYKRIANIARVGYAAHQAYLETLGERPDGEWRDLSHFEQKSVILSVEYLLVRGHSPKKLHDLWLTNMVANGWKYGEQKNPMLFEHPRVMAYDELSPDKRLADELFHAVIIALAKDLYMKKSPKVPKPF